MAIETFNMAILISEETTECFNCIIYTRCMLEHFIQFDKNCAV